MRSSSVPSNAPTRVASRRSSSKCRRSSSSTAARHSSIVPVSAQACASQLVPSQNCSVPFAMLL
eukprot:2575275-Prymnesium_polylepis.2